LKDCLHKTHYTAMPY